MKPRRIISLCPSISETLAELGVGERLVGVTRYCVRPTEVMRGIAKVGGTKHLDLEMIEALDPDLVFANAEENDRAQVERLQRTYHVHVSMPRRGAEVPGVIREFGSEIGQADAGARLAAEVEEAWRGLEGDLPSSRFRYVCLIWKDPWMAVSDDTYVADVLRLAGGDNTLGKAKSRYPVLTAEMILAAAPEVVFLPSEPYPFRDRHLEQLRKVLGAGLKLQLLAGDDLCWHGARTLRGLALARALRQALVES